MCSFIVTNKEIKDIDYINYYTKKRGNDYTNSVKIKDYTFIHNLLHITGKFTIQPNIEEDIVCVFNGEIYNYKNFGNYDNDSKCIIPLYKEFGTDFIKKIDGEFSISIFDFKTKKIIVTTDVFSTKPLWMSINFDKIGICSYKDPLNKLNFTNIEKIQANECLTFDMKDYNLLEKKPVYCFGIRQYKKDFYDFNEAFSSSIEKRTRNTGNKLFLGLSSGYDSGSIVCELLKQDKSFTTYTVVGSENNDILNQRLKLITNKKVLEFSTEIKNSMYNYIEKNVEDFKYVIHSSSSDYNEFNLSLKDDYGSTKLAYVCEHAKKDGKKISLSGSGADEIFSDYGFAGRKIYPHSNFGGLFPENLNKIFPWASFYGSSQQSYLMKEEYIGGSYNLETRYPFLDKKVVQEFLWLDHTLKNKYYKSVLHNYLTINNFPFIIGEKLGF